MGHYQNSEEEPPKEVTLPEVRAVLANKSRAGFTDEVKGNTAYIPYYFDVKEKSPDRAGEG